jgi:hypothetical protein
MVGVLRIWGFHLENGLTAMVTSAELLNQKKFQTKLIGVGVLPLDVRPDEWKETVVQRILQAAEPWKPGFTLPGGAPPQGLAS